MQQTSCHKNKPFQKLEQIGNIINREVKIQIKTNLPIKFKVPKLKIKKL